MNRISIVAFSLVALLAVAGCGSSSSRTAEQKQKQATNEVAAAPKPVPQDATAQLGVSKPYQIGEPKGGCKMIVIYDKDGSVRTVASCDSDKNGNVLSVQPLPLKVSANKAAELFLQP